MLPVRGAGQRAPLLKMVCPFPGLSPILGISPSPLASLGESSGALATLANPPTAWQVVGRKQILLRVLTQRFSCLRCYLFHITKQRTLCVVEVTDTLIQRGLIACPSLSVTGTNGLGLGAYSLRVVSLGEEV